MGGIGSAHLFCEKILVDFTGPDQVTVNRGNQIGMLRRRNPPVIGQRADIPQCRNIFRRAGQVPHLEIIDQVLERPLVHRRHRPRQPLNRRDLVQTGLQVSQR